MYWCRVNAANQNLGIKNRRVRVSEKVVEEIITNVFQVNCNSISHSKSKLPCAHCYWEVKLIDTQRVVSTNMLEQAKITPSGAVE